MTPDREEGSDPFPPGEKGAKGWWGGADRIGG